MLGTTRFACSLPGRWRSGGVLYACLKSSRPTKAEFSWSRSQDDRKGMIPNPFRLLLLEGSSRHNCLLQLFSAGIDNNHPAGISLIDTSNQRRFLALFPSANTVLWSRAGTSPDRSDRVSAMRGEDQTMIVFDAGKMRPYCAADLDRLLRFVSECNRTPSVSALPHPGDVVHHMSNTLRGRDLERHIFLYEQTGGRLRALMMLYPGATWSYELLLDPDLRNSSDDAFEAAALNWAGNMAWAASQSASQSTEVGEVGGGRALRDTARQ